MTNLKESIITVLKEELEHNESDTSYSQWVLGVSVSNAVESSGSAYTARVVVKTSTSPYVDGMDISLIVADGKATIDSSYFENSPDFHGGTVETSLSWLQEFGEIIYLQLEIPY